MKAAKPPRRITSADFRERTRHYRLAETIADAPRDVEMFHDLATMFERLSEDYEDRFPLRGRDLLSGFRDARDLVLAVNDPVLDHDRQRSRSTLQSCLHVLGRRSFRLPSDAGLHRD